MSRYRSNADQRRRTRAIEFAASCRIRGQPSTAVADEAGSGTAGTGRGRRGAIYVSFYGDKWGGDLLID